MEKKNYFTKRSVDFFKEDAMDWLLSQPNGCKYVVIFEMLINMTANVDGFLLQRLSDIKTVPFTTEKIRRDVAHFSGNEIEKALELFMEIGLICEDEDGVLFIDNYERFVGKTNGKSDDHKKALATERQRKRREKLKNAVNSDDNVTRDTERDTERDIQRDTERDVTQDVTQTNNLDIKKVTGNQEDKSVDLLESNQPNAESVLKNPILINKSTENNDNNTSVTRDIQRDMERDTERDVTQKCHDIYRNKILENRYINDDDSSGKIPDKNDKYNLSPKTDEDYQLLVDEMLSTNPFERPDISTSVEEEKNLIDEMFNCYDSQKVLKAMKKAKDNRAKSFTYARQILEKQGDSSTKPLKASKQELVIPCKDWDEMLSAVTSDARKDILEETPEEFINQVLEKTKFYSLVEITDALRIARLELEQSFEGDEDEKVYAYFDFLLRFQGSLSKEAIANNVDPQTYILKRFNSLWEKQNE